MSASPVVSRLAREVVGERRLRRAALVMSSSWRSLGASRIVYALPGYRIKFIGRVASACRRRYDRVSARSCCCGAAMPPQK